ncbi:MAG: TldD/PmbA family protein [Clostridiales bacterium]|nr:TldD/PmbA family protein [Clostridiales bacterium]
MQTNAFIEKLFARAKEAGFTACEAFVSESESFSAGVFKGELISYESEDRFGLGFRGLYNGKMGYASTQVLDDDAIELLVGGAKENASLIEDEDRQFLHPGGDDYARIDSWNDGLEQITAAEKIAMARALEEKALGQDGRIEQTDGCQVFSSAGTTTIVNTLGLNVTARGNLLGGYVAPTARDGERVGSGYSLFAAVKPEDIDLEKTAKEAAERAIASMYGDSVPSGHMRALIRPEAAAELLATFSGVFSADAAQKGLSLLKGREGEQVAAKCVTLVDDPHRADSAASSPFDGEGVATARHDIIKDGVLVTLLHNLKTANKQGVKTTANATRSYNSTVGIAPTNFFIQPGACAEEELLAALGDGLIITDVEGLHAGANAISGDFSLSAKGHRVEGGRVVAPVKQITVAGNFFALLKDVEAVGADLRFGYPGGSWFGSPTLLVRALSVAGKDAED